MCKTQKTLAKQKMSKMNKLILLLLIIVSKTALAQDFEPVADLSFKLGILQEEVKYYAFDEGDIVKFEFNEQKGKGIKSFEFGLYEQDPVFSKFKPVTFDKEVTIASKGIYQLTMNNQTGARMVELIVKRNNSNGSGLSTEVVWKDQNDTTWTTKTEKYLDTTIYKAEQVHDKQSFYINSATNLGGKTRVGLPLPLTENTVEWYYIFSCSRDKEEIEKVSERFNLLGEITGILATPVAGKVATVTAGILTKPPGANHCDIYVLTDETYSSFINKASSFTYVIEASRENYKSGVVQTSNLNYNNLYLGLRNNDLLHGIHVAIEVVAITENKVFKEREVKEFTVETTSYPDFAD